MILSLKKDCIIKDLYFAFSIIFLTSLSFQHANSQVGYPMQPVSGADGKFDIVHIEDDTVYRSQTSNDGYHFYIYFKTSEEVKNRTVYVEITYLDTVICFSTHLS